MTIAIPAPEPFFFGGSVGKAGAMMRGASAGAAARDAGTPRGGASSGMPGGGIAGRLGGDGGLLAGGAAAFGSSGML